MAILSDAQYMHQMAMQVRLIRMLERAEENRVVA
jgi:hypothetical protein